MRPRQLKPFAVAVLALITASLELAVPAHADDIAPVRVPAAGSLRTAIGEVGAAIARLDKRRFA
jgi:hypothetical protein